MKHILNPTNPEDGASPAKQSYGPGTQGPWRQGWDLSEEEVEFFSQRAVKSAQAKKRAQNGEGKEPIHPINVPMLNPLELMPRLEPNQLQSLSLFSGGGGLDLGFDLAGFTHVASFDILPIAGETLQRNRPEWQVFSGPEAGNVCLRDWRSYRHQIDMIHGGPPCQPFSTAGRQLGSEDTRDMIPEFVRAVLECEPRAFVMENVAALSGAKFQDYLDGLLRPLLALYRLKQFELKAEWFGVPQQRIRLFIVGFRSVQDWKRFQSPNPTYCSLGKRPEATDQELLVPAEQDPEATARLRTMGVRKALGLPDSGFDDLAPTMRSGFSGPRGATSVNSSVGALRIWTSLGIWPHGVAADRESARRFVPENDNFRLSVHDCGIIQGFPESWSFAGPVYAVLGQIGNSVAPPVAYQVARSVARALLR